MTVVALTVSAERRAKRDMAETPRDPSLREPTGSRPAACSSLIAGAGHAGRIAHKLAPCKVLQMSSANRTRHCRSSITPPDRLPVPHAHMTPAWIVCMAACIVAGGRPRAPQLVHLGTRVLRMSDDEAPLRRPDAVMGRTSADPGGRRGLGLGRGAGTAWSRWPTWLASSPTCGCSTHGMALSNFQVAVHLNGLVHSALANGSPARDPSPERLSPARAPLRPGTGRQNPDVALSGQAPPAVTLFDRIAATALPDW